MDRTEKLFKFNEALYTFKQVVEQRNKIKKLEKEENQSDSVKKEIEQLRNQIVQKEALVRGILLKVLGDEKLISAVKINYDDIHVVENFQNYMNLI